ncbi:MAG: hypothetical protein EOL92_07065 [Bacteroidia bacterium]|nr:hypothetical protein [Bacteroidia bacterium]
MRFDGKKTKRNFTELELKKLSVVGNPAQSHALACIIKSANNDVGNEEESCSMTYKKELTPILGDVAKDSAVMKKLDEVIASVVETAVKAKCDEIAKAEEARLAKEAEAKKAAEDLVEIGGQKVAKSEVPAEVMKAIEMLEKQRVETEKKMEDLQKKLDMEACVKEAEAKYPHLSGSPEEKGQVMYSLKSLSAPERESIEKALEKANSIMGEQFGCVGYGYNPEPTSKTSDLEEAIKAMGGDK